MIDPMDAFDIGSACAARLQSREFPRIQAGGQIEQHLNALGSLRMTIAGKMFQILFVDNHRGALHRFKLTSNR